MNCTWSADCVFRSVSVCYGRSRVGDRVVKNNVFHEYILNDIITARIFICTDKTEKKNKKTPINYLKILSCLRFHIEKGLIKACSCPDLFNFSQNYLRFTPLLDILTSLCRIYEIVTRHLNELRVIWLINWIQLWKQESATPVFFYVSFMYGTLMFVLLDEIPIESHDYIIIIVFGYLVLS